MIAGAGPASRFECWALPRATVFPTHVQRFHEATLTGVIVHVFELYAGDFGWYRVAYYAFPVDACTCEECAAMRTVH